MLNQLLIFDSIEALLVQLHSLVYLMKLEIYSNHLAINNLLEYLHYLQIHDESQVYIRPLYLQIQNL